MTGVKFFQVDYFTDVEDIVNNWAIYNNVDIININVIDTDYCASRLKVYLVYKEGRK